MSTSLDLLAEWSDAHEWHRYHNEDCPFCADEEREMEEDAERFAKEFESKLAAQNIKSLFGCV